MKKSASQTLLRPVNRGVLSIEMVIILAVIVIMVIYIFANSGSLFRKNDTTMELGNAQEIMTQTRTLLKTQGLYDFANAASMTGTLVQFGGVPNSMTLIGDKSAGTATVINTWGGAVTVQPEVSSGGSNTGFSLTYENVPQESCVTIAIKMSQTTVVSETAINDSTTVGAVSAANAGSQCVADNGSNGTNTLKFTSMT
jgi:uncharacterized membrane protein